MLAPSLTPPLPLPPCPCPPSPLACLPLPAPAGMKLFGVGFFASLLGVGITNALMAARQMLDPAFVPLNPPQARHKGEGRALCLVWALQHAGGWRRLHGGRAASRSPLPRPAARRAAALPCRADPLRPEPPAVAGRRMCW